MVSFEADLEPILRALSVRWKGRTPPSPHTHIHTFISTYRGSLSVRNPSMFLEGRRKLENQEETHTDMWKTCEGTPQKHHCTYLNRLMNLFFE